MKKSLFLLLSVSASLLSANLALADIYKRVDADGRITYSNVKSPNAIRIQIDPEENNIPSGEPAKPTDKSSRAQNKRVASPVNFPKVDKETQNQRDDKRKEILLTELEAEKEALANAQLAFQEGQANPEIYHKKNADGSVATLRNVPKFNAKMEALRAEVEGHQKNIDLLQKEISALR